MKDETFDVIVAGFGFAGAAAAIAAADAGARVLLLETSLPIEEIAGITGLDVYRVAAMKLKLREEGKSRKAG